MEKFRIKVVEQADGIKYYEPQVYTFIGVNPIYVLLNKIISIKKEKRWILQWRSFVYRETDGLKYLTGLHYSFGDMDLRLVDENTRGLSCLTIGRAEEIIDEYIAGQKALVKVEKEKKEKEQNEVISHVKYFEVLR